MSSRLNIPGPAGESTTDKYDDFAYDSAAWTLTAHEARPGHELQFDSMLEHGVSVARAKFAFNSTNVEGWGLYAEYLIKPYMPADGQLISLHLRLLRAARAFLDPELQAGTIQPDDAYRVLEKDVVISHAFAKEEVERFTYRAPGQANSYFYGYTKLSRFARHGSRSRRKIQPEGLPRFCARARITAAGSAAPGRPRRIRFVDESARGPLSYRRTPGALTIFCEAVRLRLDERTSAPPLSCGPAQGNVADIPLPGSQEHLHRAVSAQERPMVAERYRGAPRLNMNPETGESLCIACNLCALACPENLIVVGWLRDDATRRKVLTNFTYDTSRCMFCGLCEDACPTDCLELTQDFEMANYSREGAIWDRHRLEAGPDAHALHSLIDFAVASHRRAFRARNFVFEWLRSSFCPPLGCVIR